MYDPDFISDGYYHVYNRSNNRELLFKNFDNYHYFLNRYAHYLNPWVHTLGYCLMPTHFHFLIRVKSTLELKKLYKKNLSIAIEEHFRRLFISYSKSINKQRNRHGNLFQRPFKRSYIDDQADVVKMLCYIHHNPIHHGHSDDYHKWYFSSFNQWSIVSLEKQNKSLTQLKISAEALIERHKEFKKEYQEK